jgi:hypothetical protein
VRLSCHTAAHARRFIAGVSLDAALHHCATAASARGARSSGTACAIRWRPVCVAPSSAPRLVDSSRTTARACLPVFACCRPVSPAARLRSCRIRPTHDSRSSTAAARPRPCRWTAGMHACHRLAQGEMGLVRSSIHQFLLEDFSYPVLFGEPLLCGWCATVTSDVSSFASPPTGSARSLCDSVATRQASISGAMTRKTGIHGL